MNLKCVVDSKKQFLQLMDQETANTFLHPNSFFSKPQHTAASVISCSRYECVTGKSCTVHLKQTFSHVF